MLFPNASHHGNIHRTGTGCYPAPDGFATKKSEWEHWQHARCRKHWDSWDRLVTGCFTTTFLRWRRQTAKGKKANRIHTHEKSNPSSKIFQHWRTDCNRVTRNSFFSAPNPAKCTSKWRKNTARHTHVQFPTGFALFQAIFSPKKRK